MTRAQMAVDIAARQRGWFDMSGLVAADTPTALGRVIDAVFRQLGRLEEDIPTATVDPTELPAYYALSDWYALLAFRAAIGPMVDLSTTATGVTKARSQAYAQLESRIVEAERAASPYIRIGSAAWGAGTLDFDIIEPEDPDNPYRRRPWGSF